MNQSDFNTQAQSKNSRAHAYRTAQHTASTPGVAVKTSRKAATRIRDDSSWAILLLIPVAVLLVGAVAAGYVHLAYLQDLQSPGHEPSSMLQGAGLLGKALLMEVVEVGLHALFGL